MSKTGVTRTITVASGKGGVGKTSISVNLALQLARLGYRTCLFDADLGLANINILLGLNPEYTVEDVVFNGRKLQDIIIRDYQGIDIIPGSSGVEGMADLEDEQVEQLTRSFAELPGYDFLLVDTSAGVSRHVIAFCVAASELVLIITPEPTSLTDGYALLKILSLNGFEGAVKVVINRCKGTASAKSTYRRFKEAVRRYLQLELIPLGVVLEDQKVVEAVTAQTALLSRSPESDASRCIRNISKNLLELRPDDANDSSMTSFWTKCFTLIRSPLTFANQKKEQEGSGSKAETAQPDRRPSRPVQGSQNETPSGESTAGELIQAPDTTEEKSPQSECLDEENLSPVTVDACATESMVRLDHAMPSLMKQFTQCVSSLAQELHLIRKTLEEYGRNGVAMGGSAATSQQQGIGARSIILDYDSFLESRRMNESEEDHA